jgi:hypothetical protein
MEKRDKKKYVGGTINERREEPVIFEYLSYCRNNNNNNNNNKIVGIITLNTTFVSTGTFAFTLAYFRQTRRKQ